MNSDTATQIMDTHMKGEWRDRNRLNNPITCARVNDNGRTAQVDMIRSHWDNMDEETQARAKLTLDEIGGNDLTRGIALS